MSRVERCRACGALFAFLPRGFCAPCIDLRESRYHDVREWLLDNRGVSILTAAEATGVEESLIMQWLREGRLEFVGTGEPGSPAEEQLKARIRRDLAARGVDGVPVTPAGAGAPPAPVRRSLGMRSRER